MTDILLSYNEVSSTARKAASGAGLPQGVAEEIGQAAAWLSARGLDAIAVVVRALSGNGPQVILAGLPAIDTLCCGEEPEEAALESMDCSLLLLALAGVAAGNAGLSLAAQREDKTLLPLDAACREPATDRLRLVRHGQGNASEATLSSRPAATSEAAYTAALQLAAKTYVPASDLSRAMGAGAGTTDND
ncbi:DUF3726 domain-containing protein [Rhizobium sp. YJ-22]|uniref:DUF3726 domain-containing protein n=1 Tax=Rhizobium sp. YJ-22 TaxID=3037556 RepID=UPI002412358C|nr:DUF3726 domain-containing protein [Rhizobium sp. YJ-22]MDG3578191.1 DUF3726 domain-containing protein [Rhizobium sp. YJ-22]